MKPKIRYVIASRDQGIAEVQFQVNSYLIEFEIRYEIPSDCESEKSL